METNYEYGELSQDGSTVEGSKNTGNIARQTLTVPGTSFVQSYRYDSLYRLTEAVEKTGTTQNWIQNWSYDRYGNRSSFTQNIAGDNTATNPTVDQNTNRFTSTDFVYDKNGNVINDVDPVTSLTRTFVFNGDNKQTEVKNANGDPIGQYFYDGEGKRVKKIVGDETTVFVYSSGKLVAEYSTQTEPNPAINYTTTDHLGSPRIITDQFGQVTSRRDFLPFGEQINLSVGNRSNLGIQYSGSTDGIRQKFTGYQKDEETSLDFAEARMYENRFGRFTAVDPLLASGKSANPQTFNRYAYALSDPVSFLDHNGMDPVYFQWVRREGQLVRNFSTDSRKANDSKWQNFDEDPVMVYGRYNGAKKSTWRIIERDGIYDAGDRSLADIARSRLPGNPDFSDPKSRMLVDELGKRGHASMQMIAALSGGALVGGLAAVPAVAAEGVILGGTIVGEAFLAEKNIRDQAADQHEMQMAATIDADKKYAVSQAWKQEAELVRQTGQGTVDWTPAQIEELLENGKVQDFEGHHINSVNGHPELARDPNNIRFANGRTEHLELHNGNWRNPTEGPLIRRIR